LALNLVLLWLDVINVSELDLVVFFVMVLSRVTSEAAWFDKEHDWDQDDNNNEEGETYAQLGVDGGTNEWSETWGFGFTKVGSTIDS
jgi:hypothetical protein